MIIGQTVFTGSTGSAENFYTPWVATGGNYAAFTLEILNLTSGVSITVETQTKNSEQDDKEGATADQSWTSSAFTTADLHTFEAGKTMSAEGSTDHGLLELVRFKIEVSANEQGLANIRMLAPSYQTN